MVFTALSWLQAAALELKEPIKFPLCQPEGFCHDFNKTWSETKGFDNLL